MISLTYLPLFHGLTVYNETSLSPAETIDVRICFCNWWSSLVTRKLMCSRPVHAIISIWKLTASSPVTQGLSFNSYMTSWGLVPLGFTTAYKIWKEMKVRPHFNNILTTSCRFVSPVRSDIRNGAPGVFYCVVICDVVTFCNLIIVI